MKCLARFTFICLVCFFTTRLFPQHIDSALALYANNYPQERMYIQFDKPAYTPGATIWFKVYLTAGNLPSYTSKNLYADFYDAGGNLLSHSVFPVVEASAACMFVVPDSLNGSSVYIKAYTAWMLNFDTAFVYEKGIPVVQKILPSETLTKITVVPSIRFLPEGGDVIEGLPSRIAFTANDQYGKPVTVKGIIKSNTGVTVDTIKTEHDGMGSIRMTYTSGEVYTARWYDEQGMEHQTPMPAAKPSGVAMEIASIARKKLFIIRRTDSVSGSLKQLHIAATMNQQLVYKANVNLTETGIISGAISTDSLTTGILQITLFNSNWQPLAERICYVNKNDAVFTPGIEFSKLDIGKRGKNTIDISIPDSIICNLSIAITDKGVGTDSSNNIISGLLLTGDIKGAVHKPQYYFSNNSDSVARHLDLVMLTHGWRRFNWQTIVQGAMPAIRYPAETNYLILSGKIYGANSKQLRSPGKIYAVLRGKDSSRQIASVDIKEDGTFEDPNIILFDSTRIISRFSNKSFAYLKDVQFFSNIIPAQKHINFDTSKIVLIDTSGNARVRFLASENTRLAELLKRTTLAGVTVTTKALSPVQRLEKRYVSGMFRTGDAYQLDLTNNPVNNLYRNVFDYLQNKIGVLYVSATSSGKVVLWNGNKTKLYLNEDPVEAEVLFAMPVADIAYVKGFRSFFGNYGGGGRAIAVYTRKGSDQLMTKGVFYKTVIGYTSVKEFYSPDYEMTKPGNEGEDIRSTLYWNPMIVTLPEDRRLSFTFYNNDITHAFRVIAEGVSSGGKLVHIEKVVE